MFKLKWTDQDMINFARTFSEYEISIEHLVDYREGKAEEVFKRRVAELVSRVVDNPGLLPQIEKIIYSR